MNTPKILIGLAAAALFAVGFTDKTAPAAEAPAKKAADASDASTSVLQSIKNNKANAQRGACLNNLRLINAVTQYYMLENNTTEVPPFSKLTKEFPAGRIPTCPAGGVYQQAVAEDGLPRCSLGESHGHSPDAPMADDSDPNTAVSPSIQKPGEGAADPKAQRNACRVNLSSIHSNTNQYMLENMTDDVPPLSEVAKMFQTGLIPTCPAGGVYRLAETARGVPRCSLEASHGHSLRD